MKIDMTFRCNCICRKVPKNQDLNSEDFNAMPLIELEFLLNEDIASNFVFRFAPNIFSIISKNGKQYQTILKFDKKHNFIGIAFMDSENLYVVLETEQFVSNILDGYLKTKILNHYSSILDQESHTNSEVIEDNILKDS